MSFLSQLNAAFESSVKEGPWLQYVGWFLALGGIIGRAHWYGIPLAYVGLGIAGAGYLYKKIYN